MAELAPKILRHVSTYNHSLVKCNLLYFEWIQMLYASQVYLRHSHHPRNTYLLLQERKNAARYFLMDQTQTRAQTALQPFLHLALTSKTPSPRMLADLITRATSAPGTYIFAELLETPAVQALQSLDTPQEFRGYYTALEIFSYGTLAEYDGPLSSPDSQHGSTE
jgi:hypothetical protein